MSDKDIEPQQAFPYTGLGSDGMTLRDYFAAKVMARPYWLDWQKFVWNVAIQDFLGGY